MPHVLLECPVFGRQRANLEIKLKIDLKIDSIKDIMTSKHRDSFIKYCIEIAKIVIDRNKT